MTTSIGINGTVSQNTVLSNRGGSFGDNPFLLLLTEQLKNQTPLEPVDNESFMNQMASYSSMQQQQDLNKNMLALLDYQGLLARMQGLSQGSALLGKEVSYTDAQGSDTKGVVESVYVAEDGEVKLKLEDGAEVSLRDIHSIATADTQA
jgi:flagellar basal-body rod modification protein FlgD